MNGSKKKPNKPGPGLVRNFEGNVFINGVQDAKRWHGILENPSLTTIPSDPHEPAQPHQILKVDKPGVFLSAFIWTIGNDEGKSCVGLRIDGNPVSVVYFPFAKGPRLGVNHNSSGIDTFETTKGSKKVRTMTIGFQTPLYFESKIELNFYAWEEVEQVIGEIFYGGLNLEGGPVNGHGDPGGKLP